MAKKKDVVPVFVDNVEALEILLYKAVHGT